MIKKVAMPIQEVVDRWTVSKLKLEHGGNNEDEVLLLREVIDSYNDEFINVACDRLYEINKKIWNLETGIRNGYDQNISMEEIGDRSIQVRDWNSKRIEVRNEIFEKYREGFLEFKIEHISK